MIAGWRAEGVGTSRVARLAEPAAGALCDPDRRQGRAALLLLARQGARPRRFRPRRETRSRSKALCRLRRSLPFGHLAVALRRGRARALLRRHRRRASARGGASPSTPISGRAAGPTERRATRPTAPLSAAPTSFSLRPKISNCCSADGANEFRHLRASAELVLKLVEPACRVIFRHDVDLVVPTPVARRRRHDRRRRQLRRRLLGGTSRRGRRCEDAAAGRASACRHRRLPPWRDHPARGDAGRPRLRSSADRGGEARMTRLGRPAISLIPRLAGSSWPSSCNPAG